MADIPLEELFELTSDPLVTEYLSYRHASMAEAAAYQRERSRLSPEAVWWSLWLLDGVYLGQTGLTKVDRAAGTAEVGITLGRRHWGQGYGREALGVIVRAAADHWGLRTLAARCLAENERSARMLTASGFEPVGEEPAAAPIRGARRVFRLFRRGVAEE